MKEFVLMFRNAPQPDFKPSAAQLQAITESWMNWMGSIAAENKLAHSGNRLSLSAAKTVRAGGIVTDGPYTEIKEFINGYIVVKCERIEDAVAIAEGCPILQAGGNVEVRAAVSPDDNS